MEALDECSGVILDEPISISDLVQNGAKWSLKANFNDDDTINEIFEDFELSDSNEEDENEKLKDEVVSPWESSFLDLKKQMIKCNENLFKRITTAGNMNSKICPEDARVTIQYNCYWEKEKHPFDSTTIRGANLSFFCGRNEVLEGIEAAVRTMRNKEEAQFVISYKILYGEMGCPPRIRPKSDGLYVIKLLNFSETQNENALNDVPAEDRNKFSVIYPKIKKTHSEALESFRLENYRSASRLFKKAVRALEFCRLSDAEEENEQRKFLIKLYINLAICYNKLSVPTKACLMCNEIRKLANINHYSKALFQEGRALLSIGEYGRARKSLKSAQLLSPNNMEISNELKVLDERYEKYKTETKSVWQKALGMIEYTESKEMEKNKKLEMDATKIREQLERLKADDNLKSIKLPDGLEANEIQCFKSVAEELELNFACSDDSNGKVYTISNSRDSESADRRTNQICDPQDPIL